MDIDTIMPSMIGDAGGTAFHVGLLVTIMLGGSRISQLFFAHYLNNKHFKKKFLLLGINLRILSLAGMAMLFFTVDTSTGSGFIWTVLLLAAVFAFSGAFANINYIDIMGKSVLRTQRKSLLSLKQVITAVGVLTSALIARRILTIYGMPMNYTLLFSFAAIFLLVASMGFWRLQEVRGKRHYVKRLADFLSHIKKEIKINRKLKNYLLTVNTLGVAVSILPFLVVYSKENFATSTQVGNMLLLKVIGAVCTGLLLYYASKRFRYGVTLYIALGIALAIPALVILSGDSYDIFILTFLMGGTFFVVYTVSINGILLEISRDSNRALYAGAAGAGSLLPAVFSLMGGLLIQAYGFDIFFAAYALTVSSSVIFIRRLDCRK